MRKHDNSHADFNIKNETVLQKVDYERFEDKTLFRSAHSPVGQLSWSQQSLQLDIEVEINESLQSLLNSPQSSNTDLIDVTLIRETPSFPETTVPLAKSEVKRFLDMVSRNKDQRNYTNTTKNTRPKAGERKGFYKPFSLSTTDEEARPIEGSYCGFHGDQTESIYTDYSANTYDNKPNDYHYTRHENVYATPDIFTKLRSSLACQHHRKYGDDNRKPGTPCLCQHCGMIGVLIESQKRPHIPHPETRAHRPRSEHRKERRPRTVAASGHEYSPRYHQENYNAQTEILSQETLFDDLLSKLRSLEARVLAQEEQAVGKDYFKYVIRKMLSQYIAKMVQSELPDNVKTSGTQCSRIFLGESEVCKTKNQRQQPHRQRRRSSGRDSSGTDAAGSSADRKENEHNKAVRKHNKIDLAIRSITEDDYSRSPKFKNVSYFDDEPTPSKRKHWKDCRMEDDLKDRIFSLIEAETNCKDEKHLVFSPEKSSGSREIKVESFQNTICLPQVIQSGRMLAETPEMQEEKDRTVTNSALKELLDKMSSQIYEDMMKNKSAQSPNKVEQPKFYNNMQKALDDTLFKSNIEASKKREMHSARIYRKANDRKMNRCLKDDRAHTLRLDEPLENLNVKYLSPAADMWGESSNAETTKRHQPTIKSEKKIAQKDSLTYKIEYLKGLARSKNINEDELWRSIWRQTKYRFKSKHDILTISIPSRKFTKRPIELDLTWSDLKRIMRTTRLKSPHEVSSCDLLYNQKKSRECDLYQQEYSKKNRVFRRRSKTVK